MHRFDPVLRPVPFDELRPTQVTVGYREVKRRRAKWSDASGEAREALLKAHAAPAVAGPKGRFYIVDHHHLARALYEEGAPGLFVQTLADYSKLDKATFWTVLDHHGWVHAYNAGGKRIAPDDMPRHVKDLEDDPFRSLAGEVRRLGGFAKDATPFAEFLWAGHFRNRIKRALVEDEFESALERALSLARRSEADYLPGWCGPEENAG